MVGLWLILVKNAPELYPHLQEKCLEIFQGMYMDNGMVSSETSEGIQEAFEQLAEIFGPYCFGLQQFATNDPELRKKIADHVQISNLLGLDWDTHTDTIQVKQVPLDPEADTLRKLLSSLASVFDPLGARLPLLNRARLFIHKLQVQPEKDWDNPISQEDCKEWRKILNSITAHLPRL